MSSNLTPLLKYLSWLLLTALMIVSSQFKALAEETRQVYLRIKPSQCVSLHQGQDCYVQLNIHWQAAENGDYCLYSSQDAKAIFCWQEQQSGKQQMEMKIKGDTQFWLKHRDTGEVIAQTLVKQAWVHKKQPLSFSSWRVF